MSHLNLHSTKTRSWENRNNFATKTKVDRNCSFHLFIGLSLISKWKLISFNSYGLIKSKLGFIASGTTHEILASRILWVNCGDVVQKTMKSLFYMSCGFIKENKYLAFRYTQCVWIMVHACAVAYAKFAWTWWPQEMMPGIYLYLVRRHSKSI